jgi:transcription elongation factor Elf1
MEVVFQPGISDVARGFEKVSREHRKYSRETIAKSDKAQTCFTKEGELESLRIAVLKEETGLDMNTILSCPFCLIENRVQRFLVSTKKGISTSRTQCPSCGEGMFFRTLNRKWTAETYAKWVFDYGAAFWRKIKFENWKAELSKKGWAEGFWDVYKRLKAENPKEESYEDRMNRLGEETAQQWLKESQENMADA